jgi:hypothetical protein
MGRRRNRKPRNRNKSKRGPKIPPSSTVKASLDNDSKSTSTEAQAEREPKANPEPPQTHFMRIRMEVCVYILGALAVVAGILAAMFSDNGHRNLALWTACSAIVLVTVAGFAWYQDWLWKRDEKVASKANTIPELRPGELPEIGFYGVRLYDLSVGSPMLYALRTKNVGQTIGTVTGLEIHYHITPAGLEESEVLWGDAENFGSGDQRRLTPVEIPLAPGFDTYVEPAKRGKIIDQFLYEEIHKGSAELIVVAQLEFTDQLGTVRRSRADFAYHPRTRQFGIHTKELQLKYGLRKRADQKQQEQHPGKQP